MLKQVGATTLAVLLAGALALAQTPAQPAGQQPPPQPKEQEKPKDPEVPTYEETVVVTASKVEVALINAPATASVISAQTIESSPAQNYADLLRAVPGLNVSQTSARDINLTSRGATSTLSTSQLTLLDGRTIYLDFFGFVAWDFLPVNLNEVKQIEVIRGPASAVWGANALSGVINVITKSPREMQGTSVTLGVGGFDRSVEGADQDAGTLFYVNGTHADAVNDRWAYKISAGAYTQDPFARPVGTIRNAFQTPYPPFQNQGTTQPKFDARVDYDFADGKKLIFAGGVAGTEGIIHSGTGPFDIDRGSVLGYAKVNYNRGAMKLNFFVNLLKGDAANLLSRGTSGQPIEFLFDTKTYDWEFGNVSAIGTQHVLSYGGNVRYNSFDLSIAPRGDHRSEVGAYLQDEIFLSDHFRWVLGGRVDKFDVIDDAVFSPRTTFMIKPAPAHTIRLSYNRAYRAPSLTNHFLDLVILNQIDLGLINPALRGVNYVFPVAAVGNEDLKEQSLNAYEIGYSGVVADRATVSAAFYFNETEDDILFTQVASYRATSPPPRWPLPPVVLDLLIRGNAFGPGLGLPSLFSYQNFGTVKTKGLELGVDASVNPSVNVFANYSWQDDPEPEGFDISELNLPPTHRFNAGLGFSHDRYLGTLSVHYQDGAFWQDVLDSRFHGPTDSYTLVNGSFGVRWAGDRFVTSIKVTNIGNEEIQQHVFGDVIKRQVVGELRVSF